MASASGSLDSVLDMLSRRRVVLLLQWHASGSHDSHPYCKASRNVVVISSSGAMANLHDPKDDSFHGP
jgi:hypothetical protein